MKSLLSFGWIVAIYLSFPHSLSGQSPTIRRLEMEVQEASGPDRIVKLIRLSAQFREENFFEEAIRLAEDAVREADFSKNDVLKAQALSEAAKAHFQTGKQGRKTAEKLLIESSRLLENGGNQPLRLSNLETLLKYARIRSDEKAAEKYATEIAAIKGERPGSLQPEDGSGKGLLGKTGKLLFGSRKQMEVLKDSLQAISSQSQQIKAQQNVLNQALQAKEYHISQLTESQVKQELLLMEKERLLDSLAFVTLIDSIQLESQDILLREKTLELQARKTQLELQNSQRNLLLAIVGMILLLGAGLYLRYIHIQKYNRQLEEKNQIILEEKQRSEELLLNILPKAVADELKDKGHAEAHFFDRASVLFTDFINFTGITSKMLPHEIVEELDYCFKAFDRIITRHGLEKIKTIGDSYMCAGGLPQPDKSHVAKIVLAALEIQSFMAERKIQRQQKGLPFFEARIGVHTGPLVAGVVGERKYAYDVWGNTVNVASRIETSGQAGKVNISEKTYELVKDQFVCTPRGKIPAKNLGEIEMYFVESRK